MRTQYKILALKINSLQFSSSRTTKEAKPKPVTAFLYGTRMGNRICYSDNDFYIGDTNNIEDNLIPHGTG